MFSLDDLDLKKMVNQIERLEIILYGNDYVKEDYYMLFEREIDEEINTILLHLWRFDGGFDHAFVNAIEIDLGLNKQVLFFQPIIKQGSVVKILEYREKSTGMSDKEEFYFDVWPERISEQYSKEFSIPFRVTIEIEGEKMDLIIPSWTPMQNIPVGRIKFATKLEIWQIADIFTVMKVIKL